MKDRSVRWGVRVGSALLTLLASAAYVSTAHAETADDQTPGETTSSSYVDSSSAAEDVRCNGEVPTIFAPRPGAITGTLSGTEGDDVIYINEVYNVEGAGLNVDGGGGDDSICVFSSRAETTRVSGGAGNDVIIVSPPDSVTSGDEGDDVIWSNGQVIASAGDDTVVPSLDGFEFTFPPGFVPIARPTPAPDAVPVPADVDPVHACYMSDPVITWSRTGFSRFTEGAVYVSTTLSRTPTETSTWIPQAMETCSGTATLKGNSNAVPRVYADPAFGNAYEVAKARLDYEVLQILTNPTSEVQQYQYEEEYVDYNASTVITVLEPYPVLVGASRQLAWYQTSLNLIPLSDSPSAPEPGRRPPVNNDDQYSD